MVESSVKINRVSSEPQETLDINSIALIDESLDQNKKIYKQNDSNNCSFDDTDINAELEMVNENILSFQDEPDKLEKLRKNREILEERLRLISRKEWLISNPIPTISLEEEILQLLAEVEFDSVSEVQEQIPIVQQTILNPPLNKPKLLQKAQIQLEKYNIILQKHAQLVQPKIKEILDELELQTIEDAIQLQKEEIANLEKLSLTKVSARNKCQYQIDLVNKILELDGRKIVKPKPDPIQNPIPEPILEPIPRAIPKPIPEPMPIPDSLLQIESLLQREKEDAASQAEFIKCAPDSFEKSVIIITHILYQIQDVEVELSAHDKYLDIPTSSYKSLIQAHMTNLKQTYIGDVNKNTQIIDKINQLEEPNGHNYKNIMKTLKEIKPLVSIFSFQEFFSYYEKACQVSQTIKNTEIILLLGTTGAGKSTSIHYLCGSKMYETEKDGLKHIAFGDVKNEDLKNVKVSPFSRSETRYIRPIRIDLPMQDSMTLVDSPGLFDLKNAEVDVSNQLGIIKALSCVKSVKPFIVFSYKKLGAKGEDFKQILNFYSQMIKDSDYFDSFNFFFSHIPNEFTMNNLTAKIKDIKEQLNEKEKQTVRLVEFLKVLIDKAENDEIHIINPLNSSKVSEILKIISRQKKKINPRSGVFQKVICDESKQKIVDQFDLHQNQIYNQFNKAGAEKVGHLLSELKKFCEIMDSDQYYKLRYNAIIQTLSQQLNKKYEEVSTEFKKQFQSTNKISEEEVNLFQSNFLFMFTLEQVRKNYLIQIDGNDIYTHSHQELEIQVAKIIKDTYQQINQPKAAKLDSNILHAYLQNLKFLSKQNDVNLKNFFKQIRKEIVEKIKISLKAIPEVAGKLMIEGIDLFEKQSVDISNSNEKANSFEQNQQKIVEEVKHNELRIEQSASQLIDEFSNLMGELERAELCFKGKLKTLLQEQKDLIIQNLLKIFEARYLNIFGDSYNMIAQNITNLSNISDLELNSMILIQMSKDNKIQKITKYYQLLQSFIKSMNKLRLSQGFIDQIEGKKSKLNDYIISWSNVQEEKLKRKVSQEKRYSEIQLIYNELMLAQNLPVLQGQIIRQNRIKMHLSKLVKDKSNEAQNYMSQIKKIVQKSQAEEGKSQDNQQISMYTLVSLRDAIFTIKNLRWTIENGNEEIYEDLVEDLEKNLQNLIILIEQSVKIRRENKSGISEIGETEQAFKQINEIQNIAELIDIKLPEMKIDEYIPEIEQNLNGAEIFLIKKRIIFAEDSKIDQQTFDELLKKSECEKFSKYYHYFKILQKRKLMVTKIDLQSKKDQSQKNYATRISEMNENLQIFVESQMEKIVQELKYTQLNKMKQYSTLIQDVVPNKEGLYENEDNVKASIYLTEYLTYPVERVLSIFKMMKELKTKYEYMWKQINPNDDEEELKELYLRFYNQINGNIARSIDNQVELTNNLKIMNQLIPLDQFIHDSNDTGKNLVQAQYDAHFKSIINFQINVVKSVEDSIKELNYEEIKRTLDTIQRLDGIDQQINLRRIKSLLNSRCNALCYSINRESRYLLKGRQLDPSTIEKINIESSELQDIIKIIGEKILDKSVYDKAKLLLDNVQTKLEFDLKQLKTIIYSLIQNQKYKEANDYIENYFESAKKFNNFNDQIEETNHIEQIEQLRTILQDSIKSKMKEFEDLKISSDQNLNDDAFLEKIINNSPKEIIKNLQSHPNFIDYAQNIKQSIEDTFSQRIGQLSPTENSILSKITIYQKYCLKLPQDLQLKFESELKELQTRFEGLQEKASSSILEIIQKWKNDESSNLKRVFDELVEIKYSLNIKCKSEINLLYYVECEKTLKSIKERLTFEIQNKLYQLWLYQSSDQIKNSLDNFSNAEYLKIIRTIKNIFESIYKSIIAMIYNKENSQENSIRIDDKDYSIDMGQLIWYNQIFENKELQNFVNEIFENFQEILYDLVQEAQAQIQRHSQDFLTIIKNDDLGNSSEIFQLIIAMRSIKPAQELLCKLSFPKYKKQIEEFVKFSKVTNKEQFCNLFKEKFNKIANQIKEEQFINSESIDNDGERKLYYERIDKQFSFIKNSQLVHEDLLEVQIDTELILQECEKNFVENYTKIEQEIQELIEDFQIIDQKKNQKLNINLENLKIIQEKFKSLVPKNFEQLKKRAIDVIQKKADNIKNQLNSQIFQSKAITDQLILQQNIAQNVKQLQDSAQEQIQSILDCLQQNSQDQQIIIEIALILKKSPVGSVIVDQQSIFINEARQFWAKKIQHQEIEYVLDNLLTNQNSKLTTQEKDELKIQYDSFQEAYTNLVEKNIAPYEDIPQNKEQIKINLLELTQMANKEKEKFGKIQKDEIYLLLAHLFALWTLSDFYKNKLKLSDSQNISSAQFILRPHPAQVVSIFRILGHGYQDIVQQDEDKLDTIKKQQIQQFLKKNNLLFDNLVQIKTGEGKSITLAIVIAVFAMWDFEVSCACYSEYLSNRDFEQFEHLYDFLNIKDKIQYGTFNTICENYINKDGKIRDIVLNTILKESQIEIIKKPQFKRRVILIDEVDVFFGKEFYNKLYVPIAEIKNNQKVSNLLDFVWETRQNPSFSFKKFKKTQQYLECAAMFKDEFLGILDEACKKMINAAQKYQNHQYVVQNEMIGYQEMDKINFSQSYGYNTIFAYYHHAQTGEISETKLQERKAIEIYCGKFSYSEIPLYSMFILGVTGTLDSLTEMENQIIRNFFQIQNFTFTPSVYGKNKLQWEHLDPEKRLLIYDKSEYYIQLTNQITEKMRGDGCQRAVIVFFQTFQLLKAYRNSKYYQELACEKQELTELCDKQDKEGVIIKATYQNTLTLTTRSYGRGTDFICRDEAVERNGGVHVILTFVPDMHSEFVQIQGRTARQGNNGSFQMILLDQYLQEVKVDVTKDEFNLQYNKKLEYIFRQRDLKMLKEEESNTVSVKEIKKKHLDALEFKDLLLQNDSSDYPKLSQYLVSINEGVIIEEDENPVKTMILMDATGSMSSFLTEAKNSVNQMFERSAKILEQHDLPAHLNWLQYVCYRNYSSGPKMILQHSPWESKPDQLKQFMDQIGTSGGQGNEAVEIGFQHAVREALNDSKIPLRQIYLIGDMPPNTQNEVDSRRESQLQWQGTQFQEPAYWESELAKLQGMNIIVNTFYLDDDAKSSFEDIAQRTGGTCTYLDVDQPNSQEILLDLFVPNILKMIGDATGDTKLGDEMVDDYARCYRNSE